ncbi:MAG: cell envelope integrity protein TolA [Hyphomicrobiaceae bacterium]
MRIGLVISSIIHAALLLWTMLTIERHKPDLKIPPPDPVVTEIISESDLAKIRQGSRTAKLDDAQAKESPSKDTPKKEVAKPKPPVAVEAPPPPPPPPPKEEVKPPEPEPPKAEPPPPPKAEVKPPEPQPDKAALDQKLEELAMLQAAEDKRKLDAAAKAAADEQARAEADAKAKAKAEKDKADKAKADKAKADKARADKAKADKAKADALAKEKAKLDTDRLSALLNKAPDPKQAPAAAPAPAAPTKNVGPVKGAKEGTDPRNAANEASRLIGMIVGRIRDKGCWNIQAGGQLAANLIPVIQFDLNRDGSVRGAPRVMNPQTSPEFQLAADAAKSAVLKCQNFELPPEKYDTWKRVTLEFDPREMFQ